MTYRSSTARVWNRGREYSTPPHLPPSVSVTVSRTMVFFSPQFSRLKVLVKVDNIGICLVLVYSEVKGEDILPLIVRPEGTEHRKHFYMMGGLVTTGKMNFPICNKSRV